MPKVNPYRWTWSPSITKCAMQKLNLTYLKLAMELINKGIQITPQQLNHYLNGKYRIRPDVWRALESLRQMCEKLYRQMENEIAEAVERGL